MNFYGEFNMQDVYRRLSDKVIEALELAIQQEDVQISEYLASALELALTRNAGGGGFVERREISEEVVSLLEKYEHLKKLA
jgi:hypothetical protein